jgi:ketosteroid isomerase-like protein
MSNQNTAIVRRIYEEYSDRGELPLELVSDDFAFDVSDAAPDIGGTHDRDAAETLYRSYAEMFDDFYVELKEVIVVTDSQVVTAVLDGGRVKNTEAVVRNEFFHVWTVRDGKVVHWSSHAERRRALEAAGLTEE